MLFIFLWKNAADHYAGHFLTENPAQKGEITQRHLLQNWKFAALRWKQLALCNHLIVSEYVCWHKYEHVYVCTHAHYTEAHLFKLKY